MGGFLLLSLRAHDDFVLVDLSEDFPGHRPIVPLDGSSIGHLSGLGSFSGDDDDIFPLRYHERGADGIHP